MRRLPLFVLALLALIPAALAQPLLSKDRLADTTNAVPHQSTRPDAKPAAPPPPAEFLELEADSRFHVSAAGVYGLPADSDSWDSAYGAEFRVYKWFKPQWGAALTLDYWDLKPSGDVVFPSDIHMVIPPTFSGSASFWAPGASLLYRPRNDWKRLHLLLEGGVQYALVDSSLQFDWSYTDHWGNEQFVISSVVPDDRFVALLGLDVRRPISRKVAFVGGAGYRLDLNAGSSNWAGQEFANELNAAFIRAGLSF